MRPRSVNVARTTTSATARLASSVPRSDFLQGQFRRRRHQRPSSSRAVRVEAFDSDPLAALDKAAALLNRAIGSTSSPSSSPRSKQEEARTAKKRWINFSASASSSVAVAPLLVEASERELRQRQRKQRTTDSGEEDPEEQLSERRRRVRGRDLLSYLALPASEYSLLDPTWVTRASPSTAAGGSSDGESVRGGGDDGEGEEEAFVVRFPLSDLVGIPLTPSFRVRVTSRHPSGERRRPRQKHGGDVDEEKSGVVAFSADRAALGDPSLDEAFEASVDATLSRKETTRKVFSKKKQKRKQKEHRSHRHHHHGHHHSDEKTKSGGVEASAAASDPAPPPSALVLAQNDDEDEHDHLADEIDASSSLCAHVTVRARVQLSGAAASIPGPVVSLAAKLVSRAVLQASLGPFLKLLVDDYWTWSVGLERGSKGSDPASSRLLLPLQVAAAATDAAVARETREGAGEKEAEEEGAEVV